MTYEIKQLLGRAAPNVNVDVRPPGAGLIELSRLFVFVATLKFGARGVAVGRPKCCLISYVNRLV